MKLISLIKFITNKLKYPIFIILEYKVFSQYISSDKMKNIDLIYILFYITNSY
jgi:hypothetical protein